MSRPKCESKGEGRQERTPGNDDPNGRVRPADDAEGGKIAHVVVAGDGEQQAKGIQGSTNPRVIAKGEIEKTYT